MARKKNPFKSFPEVKKAAAIIRQLNKERTVIERDLKDLFDSYNKRSKSVAEAERMLDKLPLDNLKELSNFANGKERETAMQHLGIRSKLRKKHSDKIKELETIIEKISFAEMDLLQVKIECLTNSDSLKEKVETNDKV